MNFFIKNLSDNKKSEKLEELIQELFMPYFTGEIPENGYEILDSTKSVLVKMSKLLGKPKGIGVDDIRKNLKQKS